MWIKSSDLKTVFHYLNVLFTEGNKYLSVHSSSHLSYKASYQPILDMFFTDKLVHLSGKAGSDVYRVTITKWALPENYFYVVSDDMESVCTFVKDLKGSGFAVACTGRTFEEVYENA